ncbi:MAG TPA: DNA mismatch repair endonuclease MutL, partial [Planctomycetota bacterium]|nr:DNA mismatch repair endonuclease MutL [Planctomycetota bacterium]
MSRAIRRLPQLLVDQIAAGEVVERPASVVRELVDNAVDAGAASIEVTIEDGGRGLVAVSDDGRGIPRDDLALAFAPHATSKLETLEDLERVATLGFRGEALASIGAVSRARLRSSTGAEAFEIDDEGGAISAPRPAARARGTDVIVRDLFFNVPARRRFLRRDATESGHAVEAAMRH